MEEGKIEMVFIYFQSLYTWLAGYRLLVFLNKARWHDKGGEHSFVGGQG
jgi:hypothetical protein